MNRHKDALKSKNAQMISEIRAKSATPEIIDEWFKKIKVIFDQYDLHGRTDKIYNCDESGFQPEQRSIRVISKRESRNPYKLSGNNPKCSYTILVCVNGNGDYLPINLIFKGVISIMQNDLYAYFYHDFFFKAKICMEHG